MIKVDSGKLTIPEDERFIGFAGDNTVVTKQIAILHRAVPDSSYTICLRFDNGKVKSVNLAAQSFGSDTLLTWTVEREDLLSTGIVTAQIRMTDGSGGVQHSTKDYFLVDSSVELDGDEESEHITPSQLEERITEVMSEIDSKASYLGVDGFWYVYDRGRNSYIKTGYRGNLQVDGEMDSDSQNPVSNSAIAAYVSGEVSALRSEIGDIETLLAAI